MLASSTALEKKKAAEPSARRTTKSPMSPVRARVPVDAEPAQVRHERGGVRLETALAVGVLDAQQETPPGAARQQQVEQRGARVSQVQLAGGTRGEAGDRLRLPARG